MSRQGWRYAQTTTEGRFLWEHPDIPRLVIIPFYEGHRGYEIMEQRDGKTWVIEESEVYPRLSDAIDAAHKIASR